MHYVHCKPTCFGEYSLYASTHPNRKKKGPLKSWKIHPPGHCCLFLGLHCPEKQLTDGINMYESPKHKAITMHSMFYCLVLSLANLLVDVSERQGGVYSFIFSVQTGVSMSPTSNI